MRPPPGDQPVQHVEVHGWRDGELVDPATFLRHDRVRVTLLTSGGQPFGEPVDTTAEALAHGGVSMGPMPAGVITGIVLSDSQVDPTLEVVDDEGRKLTAERDPDGALWLTVEERVGAPRQVRLDDRTAARLRWWLGA